MPNFMLCEFYLNKEKKRKKKKGRANEREVQTGKGGEFCVGPIVVFWEGQIAQYWKLGNVPT